MERVTLIEKVLCGSIVNTNFAKSVNKCCLFGTVSLPLRIYLINLNSATL